MTGQVKKVKAQGRYPEELKRKIAKEYLAGKASAGYLAQGHGLKDKFVVMEFVKWYRRKGELYAQNQDAMPSKKATPEELSAQEQIKQLRHKLELAELKAEALETMIDIAEKEFQIDIRKKSGAKQLKK